jgi:hypothetical protein
MPRWASRITLALTEVRLQMLQDISEADARAEGVVSGLIPADEDGPVRVGYVFGKDDGKCILYPTAVDAFAVGWEAINGKRAPWATPQLVWALSFQLSAAGGSVKVGDTKVGALIAKRLAEEEDATVSVIAERLRVHRSMLLAWARGTRLPGVKCLRRLSHYLRLTDEQLAAMIKADRETLASK